MRKRIQIIILLCFAAICGISQKVIQGRVIDKISRQPLELAYIRVADEKGFTATDERGNFSLKVKSAKQLIAGLFGYDSASIIIPDTSEFILISLDRAQADLKEVYVTAHSLHAVFSAVSKIDLNLQPAKSTQDFLKIIPGLFIAQHQGGGKAEQIFVRGIDADHGTDINISVDGLPVNMVSHAHGQGYADLHFLIPETVGNIEFGKGPYYTDIGNLATTAFARFSTLNVLDKNVFRIEGGQFNSFRALGMMELLGKKQKEKGTNAYLASEFLYTDGPFDVPQHFNRFNIFVKFNTQLGKKSRLRLIASTLSSQWNASGQIPERAVKEGLIDRFGTIDSAEGGYTSRTNISLKIIKEFGLGSWENQAYFSKYYFKLHSNFTFFLKDTINGDQIRQRESRNTFGYRTSFTNVTYAGSGKLTSELGAGFRFDQTDNSELSHTINRNDILEYKQLGDVDEKNLFLFVSESLEHGPWFFNLGARIDYFHFDYFDELSTQQEPAKGKATVSPRINLQYRLNNQTHLYIKLGKGFHSNDTRSVILGHPANIVPSAYGSDLGIFLKPTSTLLINVAAWYLYFEDELVYVGDEGTTASIGKTRRIGIDFSGRYQFNKWLFADLNVNLAKPRSLEQPKGQDYLPLAPTFTSIGGLCWKMQNGLNGSLRYRYLSKRPANEDNSIVAHGYTVTDLAFNYTRKKFETGFVLENLFNVKWNEAQFATESRLKNEPLPVEELHFTPGTPLFLRLKLAVFF